MWVLDAETAEAGLALVDREGPDLVYLDIWLPGMDGLEALDALRAGDNAPPTIMISGHGTIETAGGGHQERCL